MPKTWIVTGSARGLGRSILCAALEAGHNVLAAARNTTELHTLQEQYGDRLKPFALDVTDEPRTIKAIEAAAFGRQELDSQRLDNRR